MRGAPSSRILSDHAEDHLRYLLRSLPSSNWPPDPGNHFPIQSEASPMPSDHSFWSHKDQGLFPSRPESPHQNPEELVESSESWPGTPSLQNRELLAKSQILKKQCAPSAEHSQNRGQQESEQVRHAMLLPHIACGRERCILLNLKWTEFWRTTGVPCCGTPFHIDTHEIFTRMR